ncbi:MAG TPA: HU family DNA-binding protein [Saprospiraceae bacterium]|nr:HU family DNA-binding protein [Saprospiraceae bacterium]
MNKGELISNVADKAGLTKAQAGDALNAVLDNISGALSDGDKVTLIGFGTFSINRRNARKGRNPRTNEVIDIPAKNIVKFKAGKEFTENVQ